jgi:hypothetical protein
MSCEISDDLKKIHDTPRADSAYQHKGSYGIYQEARLLEKEMNQYKTHIEFQDKRIKLLESANSDVQRIANERNAAYERIKCLEKLGDQLYETVGCGCGMSGPCKSCRDATGKWDEYKEAKP